MGDIIYDQAAIPDLVSVIIRDENKFTQMKNEFPSILADLISLKLNPNCSCRGKVGKFFFDQSALVPTTLTKYYTQEIVAEMALLKLKRLENNISGKIFKVGESAEAWKTFQVGLSGKMFRGFSVVKEANELTVYFL